ncbi:type II toxin-antitoxin system CcdA family antitoxin [Caulobacter sp. UNC279MFTsu5.1]|uniref:type II toxin-antitoxin system CcdA family antitoxin n=1 Tax=Caulobacter sp. UNC279MFTsu5.1 TaxID=1502775 RepID=UPI0008E0E21C|nr:type II toxin-antitoxin system CcdA family antitoxin [Caulobacter sp. UNC279MFTsu5.1]SFK28767.1 antitoxin CcdA [Caulobacter sp. UNC279MFTsu5.1]
MGKVELDIGIDPELLAQAKRLGISVAGMSETQLRLHLQKIDPAGAEERARRWTEENAEALKAYRERVEKRGVFGDDLRTW